MDSGLGPPATHCSQQRECATKETETNAQDEPPGTAPESPIDPMTREGKEADHSAELHADPRKATQRVEGTLVGLFRRHGGRIGGHGCSQCGL